MRGAAASGEPGLRQLWELTEQQRLSDAGAFIETLAAQTKLREGLDPGTATDIMWVHMSPDVYLDLVGRRG